LDADDLDVMAMALHVERTYWENIKVSIANGIAIALKGD